MSDDEVDHELLNLLRQKFGLGGGDPNAPPDTKVLKDAEFICDNSIDVALDMRYTKLAAIAVHEEMQKRSYSTKAWSEHELHPKSKDEETVNFIFTMDLLNFSFWSEASEERRFSVLYRWKRWTGYWSLVAALQRALSEGIPITNPNFWVDEVRCSDAVLRQVFRSETGEEIPMFEERVRCLREAGRTLREQFECSDTDSLEEESNSGETALDDTARVSEFEPQQDGGGPQEDPKEQHNAKESSADPPISEAASMVGDDVGIRTSTEPQETDIAPKSSAEDALVSDGTAATSEAALVLEKPSEQEAVSKETVPNYDNIRPSTAVITLIQEAKGSAAGLVNLLAKTFPCFNDKSRYERKEVRFLKRAQILVADLWAAFEGEGYGVFDDIDKITMFADYRVPQILHSLGVLSYSPPLEARIRRGETIEPGHPWEVQIRGCSIWGVELLRREILKLQPDAKINAVLIDFFLYDLAKEKESAGEVAIPHHRTRSIWY